MAASPPCTTCRPWSPSPRSCWRRPWPPKAPSLAMYLCRFPCSPRPHFFRCARLLGCGTQSTIPILRYMIVLCLIYIYSSLLEFVVLCYSCKQTKCRGLAKAGSRSLYIDKRTTLEDGDARSDSNEQGQRPPGWSVRPY